MTPEPDLPFADQEPQPVYALCSCGELATHWVKEDNRVPRPICEGCLGRMQRALEVGEANRLAEARRQDRRKQSKAQRAARRTQRRR